LKWRIDNDKLDDYRTINPTVQLAASLKKLFIEFVERDEKNEKLPFKTEIDVTDFLIDNK
jgi:hypothetical protein